MIFNGGEVDKSMFNGDIDKVLYNGIEVWGGNPLIAASKAAGSVLYLDTRKATGSGLPTNSPLTSPWVDLSGLGNNATPIDMASTIVSGVDVSDPLKPFWALDGVNDIFNLVNTPSIDITSAPLAVFATFSIKAGSNNGWLFTKNLSEASDVQFGLYCIYSSNGTISAYLEGASYGIGQSGVISADTWYNVGWIWDGTNVKIYINCVQSGNTGTYEGLLTSKPNVRIGCRANNAIYLNGKIATVSVYAGVKATEANVLAAEQLISTDYLV